MFCKQCGTENAEGSAFCKNCGINLSQPAPVYAAPTKVAKPPLSSHPVLNAVKSMASSPLFLVAIIAYSVQILGTIMGSTKIGVQVEMLLYDILGRFGGALPYEIYEFVDGISRIGDIPYILGTLIGLIPAILICVGLWITYSSARNRMSNGMKTSGLTMIKVITIIQLVYSCILLALVELLLFLAVIIVAAEAYAPGVAIAILVFAVIVFAAAFVLEIIYLAKVIKSLNAAKRTITTGVPSGSASTFVAVWAFISAASLLFSLLANFLTSAAQMTSLICFGILIFKYNEKMRALMYAPQTPETPSI